MSKVFQLPKEFAENWVKALEGGSYTQTHGTLLREIGYTKSYCCLGVAACVLEIPTEVIKPEGVLDNINLSYQEKIPKDLLHYPEKTSPGTESVSLSGILSRLNDGTFVRLPHTIPKLPKELVWSIPPGKYDFKQIAQFIKDNVEFV